MSIQKEAFLAVHAEKEGISIKESYMYDPVKTLCLIYLLDEKKPDFHRDMTVHIARILPAKKTGEASIRDRVYRK